MEPAEALGHAAASSSWSAQPGNVHERRLRGPGTGPRRALPVAAACRCGVREGRARVGQDVRKGAATEHPCRLNSTVIPNTNATIEPPVSPDSQPQKNKQQEQRERVRATVGDGKSPAGP